ncbi:FAD-dependent oxidoreductase, partial [Streptococcus danieliae]|nr:FAD-dependent oxidoreductase [Streptococcus danieliae]
MVKKYDYIAIGGGSGGISSVNRAASYGQKCLLVEAKDLGGTCVNLGCVPKKVMWYGAQVAEAIYKYSSDYGFNVEVKDFNFETLVKNRTAYIERIHASYNRVLTNNGVDVVKGYAKF